MNPSFNICYIVGAMRRYGYIQYKMSKFEPYDLYVQNKSFLVSEDILTFTDADGHSRPVCMIS